MKKFIIIILFLFGMSLYAEWPAGIKIWVNRTSGQFADVDTFVNELDSALIASKYGDRMMFTDRSVGYDGMQGDLVINFSGAASGGVITIVTSLYKVNDDRDIVAFDQYVYLSGWNNKDDMRAQLTEWLLKAIDNYERQFGEAVNGAY
jgi:hypothetical protein